MKVLLFTHISDIDGMGNAVLAKLAFEEVKYVLCETFNLQNEISKYFMDGSIYDFDRIFVTDLWLEEPILSKVANDELLKGKFFVFDHHKSALEEGCNKYPFATIKISEENALCCGTSLFYEYLVSNGLIVESNQMIKDFSELTRKYDTWEWKNVYNDEMPHELSLLFDSIGCDGYIELMYNKLSQSKDESFSFNEFERSLINNKINQVKEKVTGYANKIFHKEILNLKAGIVFIDYEYRNDLAEYLREEKYDIDFIMMISLDYGTISYRTVNNDVNVRIIAEKFGGKGHDKAASSPITESQKKALIEILIEK